MLIGKIVRQLVTAGISGLFAASSFAAGAADKPLEKSPVYIGIDGEFGVTNSVSAQMIHLGMLTAVTEINEAGGVLNGRPLEIIQKDHRSIPARGIVNIEEFSKMHDLVAVFGGRFSPVIIEQMPILRKSNMPFLAAWSSADGVVDNDMKPNYVFRLSLRDTLAVPKIFSSLQERKLTRVGLLLTNTSWGRSGLAAAEKYVEKNKAMNIPAVAWYNWQDKTLIEKYERLRNAGAQAIFLVANDDEAAVLVKEVAGLPKEFRIPIVSHWGITGGKFAEQAGPALGDVDLSVIQTFSFFNAEKPRLDKFMKALSKVSPILTIEEIKAPSGVAHGYDLTHILAIAINQAGSTNRADIRDELEKVKSYRGLIRDYNPPFTSSRHEALGPEQLLMARYRKDGVLIPAKE